MPKEEKENDIIWHIRVKNQIREFHPSYRELSQAEVKLVPDEYWYPDPIHLIKPSIGGTILSDHVVQ